MAPRVRVVYGDPFRRLLAGKPALTEALRLLERCGVDTAEKLLQPSLDDRTFRFRVRRELLEAPPHVRLHFPDPRVECCQPLVALPLEHLRRILELPLEPLRAGVADMRETLGEHSLCFAREHLDRPVELARQPAGRILTRCLDEVRDLGG